MRDAVTSNEGATIIAVSGGVDSLFLLNFMISHDLLSLPNVYAVHFNHLPSRTMDSSAMNTVMRYAESKDIVLNVGYGDEHTMLRGASFEACARKQRYQFFHNFAKKRCPGHTLIITAHNLNDQVESILLGLTRGVPIDRVAMARMTNFPLQDVSIYRPLLDIPKATIINRAVKNGLQGIWEDDVTNSDMKFERNFIRHGILPILSTRRNVLKSIPKSVPTPDQIEVVQGTLFMEQ